MLQVSDEVLIRVAEMITGCQQAIESERAVNRSAAWESFSASTRASPRTVLNSNSRVNRIIAQ